MSRTVLGISVILGASLFLVGCTSSSSAPTTNAPSVEQKVGDTTKTGVISKTEGGYFLQESGKTPIMIDSYEIELSAYVGQTVTVTGQYSGDTLFVGEIK